MSERPVENPVGPVDELASRRVRDAKTILQRWRRQLREGGMSITPTMAAEMQLVLDAYLGQP